MTKLLVGIKNETTKDENGENEPHLEIEDKINITLVIN